MQNVIKRVGPRVTIYQGECLAILRELPPDSVDGLITDPPYSSGGQFRGDRVQSTSTKYVVQEERDGEAAKRPDFFGDTRDQRGFVVWASIWLAECLRIAKPGAPACLFIDWRMLPALSDAFQAAGWVWRGVLPWDKEHARPTLGRPTNQCEYVIWGSKGAMDPKRKTGAPSNTIKGVVRHRVPQDDKFHQTGKPVPVMQHLCQVVEPRGVILDPFMGSGSTLVAALREGYQAIGCELSAEYFDVTRQRLEAMVGPMSEEQA